jgi:hypothetical protein
VHETTEHNQLTQGTVCCSTSQATRHRRVCPVTGFPNTLQATRYPYWTPSCSICDDHQIQENSLQQLTKLVAVSMPFLCALICATRGSHVCSAGMPGPLGSAPPPRGSDREAGTPTAAKVAARPGAATAPLCGVGMGRAVRLPDDCASTSICRSGNTAMPRTALLAGQAVAGNGGNNSQTLVRSYAWLEYKLVHALSEQ